MKEYLNPGVPALGYGLAAGAASPGYIDDNAPCSEAEDGTPCNDEGGITLGCGLEVDTPVYRDDGVPCMEVPMAPKYGFDACVVIPV